MIVNSNATFSESSNNIIVPFGENPAVEDRPAQADIFTNLDALRLSPDAAAVAGTTEILTHVPVRKPNRHEFVRTRPEPEFWFDTGVFEDKEERETFFVAPRMREVLLGEIKPVLLVPTITRQGVLVLWPLKLPTEGHRHNGWIESAREAAELAKTRWVRLAADMQLGGYRIYQAEGVLSEPEWPDKQLGEILQIAFRDRIVDFGKPSGGSSASRVGVMDILEVFREIWCVDFEFRADPGERPWPVCMVAQEVKTGKVIRLWRNELLALSRAPFDVGTDTLFVAYFASAEFGCFLELGWPLPENVLDLYVEHRVETNGERPLCGDGLLGALAQRGLGHIDAGEKEVMRDLILNQQNWSDAEQRKILDYCASDVTGTVALFSKMATSIDWRRALLRGRYMKAVARIERTGIPIDTEIHGHLVADWDRLRRDLITAVDADFGVYENGSFKAHLFSDFLSTRRIPWAKYPHGALKLDDDTFRDRSRRWPELQPLHELRGTLTGLRLTGLEVGADGCNRCLLSPFKAVTGRNQPSNSKFIFGPATWMRGLIKPPEGCGIAYIDFASQEIGIAAALSGDELMAEGYRGGDPYMAFAKAAKLVPPDATKATHKAVRDRCKSIVLGINYGMGSESMAAAAGIAPAEAKELLRLHRDTYKPFWKWIEDTVSAAMLTNEMKTVFGWRRKVGREPNPRSLMNFPMQANGAEMMRIAAIAATEDGIEVCAPVHDAFLIAAPLHRLDHDVAKMRDIMSKAGKVVTGGLDIRTDAEIVRFPDRYMDDRGKAMWTKVVKLLNNSTKAAA